MRRYKSETHLEAVDKLGEGDIPTMAEDAQGLEVIGVGAVPEFDADEISLVWGRTSADFDGEGRRVVGQTLQLGVMLDDLGHVEERNDGLVGGLNKEDLEGVSVEGDAFQSS